jgi:hypothetical protein
MMSAPAESNTERRTALWSTLSELFVGRELQAYDYRAIATSLRASGESIDAIECCLREDVAPVFGSNLRALNPVPEMEGWSNDFVRTRVAEALRRRDRGWHRIASRFRTNPLAAPPLRERWVAVRALFDAQP